MSVEVLLSCMHQKDASIIEKSNLSQVPTLVVNQCDTEIEHWENPNEIHRMFFTNDRGLSKSRNFAIENSVSDICLIADNDEIFKDNLVDIVEKAYSELPQADVIIFKISNANKRLGNKVRKLKKLKLLRVYSPQISFRRASVINKNIKFDIKLGAGTGNGGGEENKFLFDCRKNKLKIYYMPIVIAREEENSESSWFHGYDEQFFYSKGAVNRYVMGFWLGLLYSIYCVFTKREKYSGDIKMKNALKYILKGFRENKLNKKKQ